MKCIEEMVAALQTNPKITITESWMDFYDLNDKASDKFYKEHSELRPLADLWKVIQGCSLVWKYDTESQKALPGGEFSIEGWTNIWEYERTNKEKMLSENPDFRKEDSLLNLGDAAWAGNHINVVIQIVQSRKSTQMWLYPKESYWVKLDLDFEQYIWAMCYFKCIYSWEYFFINKEYLGKSGEALVRETCAEQEKILNYLFPDLDVKKRDFQ